MNEGRAIVGCAALLLVVVGVVIGLLLRERLPQRRDYVQPDVVDGGRLFPAGGLP